MAERRMFALKIIDSDAFLDMPQSTQNLYFHLSMRADDDGFISNTKKVMRMIGASDDDMKILLGKRFLLSFDTGIVVIKHWRLHNYIAKDRYTETIYKEEKDKLFVKANGSYTDHPEHVSIPYTDCIQNDDTGKVRLVKVRKVKDSKDKQFIPPTLEEIETYVLEKGLVVTPLSFLDWYTNTDWKDNTGKQVENWKNKLLNWNTRELKEGNNKPYSKPKEYKNIIQNCPKCGNIIEFGQCVSCGTFYGLDGKEVIL